MQSFIGGVNVSYAFFVDLAKIVVLQYVNYP